MSVNLSYNNGQWININSTANTNGPAATGSMDNDPDLIGLMDNMWSQAEVFEQNPNDLNTQDFMQAVNAVMAYFTKNLGPNTPPPANAPESLAVYSFLNNSFKGNLAQVCSAYGSTGSQAAVQNLEQYAGSTISNLLTLMNSDFHASTTQVNSQIATDFDHVKDDLALYNLWMSQGKSGDPSQEQGLLTNLSNAIIVLNTDLQNLAGSSSGLTDGYLSALNLMFNTSISAAGGSTLLQLCQAVVANPGNTTDLSNLQAALTNIGETGTKGGSLAMLIGLVVDYDHVS